MFLKLLMPAYFRAPRLRPVILKWYKKEGEWIEQGDDLFEFRLERGQPMAGGPGQPGRVGAAGAMSPEAREARRAAAGRGQPGGGPGPQGPQGDFRGGFLVRVSAADSGWLRKVYAGEGEAREVGALLALVTTEADEPIDDGRAIEEACSFRLNDLQATKVVADENFSPLWELPAP
jgi:hypothetical protein